ncbi:MAG TPA: TrkA C-terminal domain-containing protein [Clostridia bacterium]|nr:TrkA C-terminal domain-containing protein [Clostridia bacterium]
MDAEGFPQYLRIAQDVASQVADGDLAEGQKISGRSLLASEYGVSPETIRRALKLLSDMKVVEVRDKSGVVILSADNARRYLQRREGLSEQQDLQSRMRELLAKQENVSKQMLDVAAQLISLQQHPSASEPLPNYEVRVAEHSTLIGRSIGALHFWQQTGATIVAIRRKQSVILSPGPYAELYGGDTIVFVCGPSAVDTVHSFVNGGVGR